jgi:hypothetical protein
MGSGEEVFGHDACCEQQVRSRDNPLENRGNGSTEMEPDEDSQMKDDNSEVNLLADDLHARLVVGGKLSLQKRFMITLS